MARKRKQGQRKKKGFFGTLFSIIGWLLLLAVILCALIFFVITERMKGQELTIDDIPAYISAEPTGVAKHLAFTQDAVMTYTMDKSDMWTYLDSELGENWMDDANDKLSLFMLRLTGVGLVPQKTGLSVDAELYFKSLRIAATVYFDIIAKDNIITVYPTELGIVGQRIPVDRIAEKTGFDPAVLTYEFKPELLFMRKIDSISVSNGTISITGPMSTVLFKQNYVSEDDLLYTRMSIKKYAGAAAIIDEYDENPAVCFAPVLWELENNPETYTRILDQYLHMRPTLYERISTVNHGLVPRWFTQITVTSEDEYLRKALEFNDECRDVRDIVRSMSSLVSKAYKGGKITVKDSKLLLEKKSFSLVNLFGESNDIFSSIFDINTMRYCFYLGDDSPAIASEAKYPRLSEITDSTGNLYGYPDKELSAAPAIVFKCADGYPGAIVFTGEDTYEFIRLDEDTYSTVMDTTLIPVLNLMTSADAPAA